MYLRGRPSQESRKCVSNVRLDRLFLRRPHIPATPELQANYGTNVSAQAVKVRFQAEWIGEQQALPIGVSGILADLPIRLPKDRAKRALKLVADVGLNRLRTFSGQLIEFPIALVCSTDVGRVLVSSEPKGMAVKNDVNIF